jgi:hypothetical protein
MGKRGPLRCATGARYTANGDIAWHHSAFPMSRIPQLSSLGLRIPIHAHLPDMTPSEARCFSPEDPRLGRKAVLSRARTSGGTSLPLAQACPIAARNAITGAAREVAGHAHNRRKRENRRTRNEAAFTKMRSQWAERFPSGPTALPAGQKRAPRGASRHFSQAGREPGGEKRQRGTCHAERMTLGNARGEHGYAV